MTKTKIDPNQLKLGDRVEIVALDQRFCKLVWIGVVVKPTWDFEPPSGKPRISCVGWQPDLPNQVGAWLLEENDFYLLT